jgi:hypothetical protein
MGRNPLVWGFFVRPSWWAPFVSRLWWKQLVSTTPCVRLDAPPSLTFRILSLQFLSASLQ